MATYGFDIDPETHSDTEETLAYGTADDRHRSKVTGFPVRPGTVNGRVSYVR